MRYLYPFLEKDLKKKMIFIGGPRQVGKTTLALHFLGGTGEADPAYINWDDRSVRRDLLLGKLPSTKKILIFDEIHKFPRWKGLMKGFYDKHKSKQSFIVTGSARLNVFKKGGDSLLGRYHYYRLHPFSLNELDLLAEQRTFQDLFQFGGFPEPLLLADPKEHARWLKERLERVMEEDLRELHRVREIDLISHLAEHLVECVGSPLSIQSLRELIGVAHATIESWICMLENLYLVFRIPPFGSSKIRAVKKEQKLYFFDWSTLPDEGLRFENLMASQLLKYCHFFEDTEGKKMELRFLRDTDQREIDFVVLENGRPKFAVECKSSARHPSPACRYFRERTSIPQFYQVHLSKEHYGNENTDTRVLPFATFCKELALP